MSLQPLPTVRFVRRTSLGPNEYRKNFRQLDLEVIAAVTSVEADRVTPLMGKIYLRLVSAPTEFWEREGVLHFAPRDEEGHSVKASKVLYEVLGVASATAHKALQWLHGQGIIGYFAGKNGVGIRIFLNRAANSIGARTTEPSKKILPFARGSNDATHGSAVEPAFKDSFADLEVLDSDEDPHAPKNSAEEIKTVVNRETTTPNAISPSSRRHAVEINSHAYPGHGSTEQINSLIARLTREIVPHVRAAAAHEHERIRVWLETRGLPKVARVAQREAYNVLRRYGVIRETRLNSHLHDELGGSEHTAPETHILSGDELMELAYCCVALFEVQGQAIERTLESMGAAAGGFLLPEDATRVQTLAEKLMTGEAIHQA